MICAAIQQLRFIAKVGLKSESTSGKDHLQRISCHQITLGGAAVYSSGTFSDFNATQENNSRHHPPNVNDPRGHVTSASFLSSNDMPCNQWGKCDVN